MKRFQIANTLTGWVVFLIAAVVYLLTIEPTASFWDCGEFIASAYKLEVGHPPGAPIFMLMGNLASHFASEPSQVSMMLNALSAIFSALTILFLFWTITHLARKLVWTNTTEALSLSRLIIILGAGAVGALAYTFSDTFWFSAVEGEVYAFSSLMTALVFWLILKWEDVADEAHSNRWLILIAYLIGVSVAIHLLNLLCIPAIVLVYYFRKTEQPTFKGAVIALLISFGIVVAILYGLVQGLVEVAGWFELLFVNSFHLPYNSGVLFYVCLVFGVLAWAIWETMRDNTTPHRAKIAFLIAFSLLGIPFIGNGYALGFLIIAVVAVYLFATKKVNPVILNSILIGLLVITIGYSSYALIMVRSAANTPMDQNSPEDIFTLRTYLSREQYGETPLFYGPTFVADIKYENGRAVRKDKGPVWSQIPKKDPSEPDRYYESGRNESYEYVDELCTIFPRMFSSVPDHVSGYKMWSDFKGKKVRVADPSRGGSKWVTRPTFAENLRYFFAYQVNFMYWRYFMWNFAGRQNDLRSDGEIYKGNWITGISFLDKLRVGPQDDMPDSIAKNKAHNKYYMLPLLLGILGIFFQIYAGKKGSQQFWVTFLLFFMTGLAIVLYLNQTPGQPRERDYAYAGSFYAFCIWIGLGTAGVMQLIKKYAKKTPDTVAAIAASAICLLVPIQMASQTWDDHDRSGRYIARDFGKNYLATCDENAIIFTNGDNDTFPLWYAQEVEGYRTDVRVCNLSYLQTDWYIDQMKRQAYESKPLPIDWKKYEYVQGKHDIAYIVSAYEYPWTVQAALDRIKSDDVRDKQLPGYNNTGEIDNVPTTKIIIPIDSAAVAASGRLKPEQATWIEPYILVDFGERRSGQQIYQNAERYIGKQKMMVLEMLKNNADWSRPIYFASSVGPDNYMRLEPYFRRDGAALRVMPYKTMHYAMSNLKGYEPDNSWMYMGGIDTDILYDNLMNKYQWGNLEQPGLYLDENCIRMTLSFRKMFGQLAVQLAMEGDTVRAEAAADRCQQVIPSYNSPYDNYSMSDIARAYTMIGAKEKATKLYVELAEISAKSLKWYNRLNRNQYASVFNEIRMEQMYMGEYLNYFQSNEKELFDKYYEIYVASAERMQQVNNARQSGLNR